MIHHSNNNVPSQDPTVAAAVEETRIALNALNEAVLGRTGSRALLPQPLLIDDVEELLKDPPPPDFSLTDDEEDFLEEVSKSLQ